MSVVIACPHCGSKLKLKDDSALGKTVRCPTCEETFSASAAGGKGVPAAKASVATTPAAKPSKAAPDKSGAMKKPSAEPAEKKKAKPAKPAEPEPAAPDDEDWGFDEIEELAPRKSKSLKAAPAVVGKKSKKKADDKSKKKSMRDAQGDYPLWVHWLMMIGSGVIGGLIAMAIWAGLVSWNGYGRGWGAILVGVLVGCGVRVGASRWDYGWGPAITASVIALASMFAGKYIGWKIHVAQLNRDFAQVTRELRKENVALAKSMEHENYKVALVAQEISARQPPSDQEMEEIEEFIDDDDYVYDEADPDRLPKRYPKRVWAEASTKWKEMPEADRAKYQKDVDEQIASLTDTSGDDEALFDSDDSMFWPLDILWAVFCVSTAFRIAAGMDDDD